MKAFVILIAPVGLVACDDMRGADVPPKADALSVQPTEPRPPLLAAAPTSKRTDCRDGETPIFSCRMSDENRLAVCAAPQGVQYRFGSEDAPQMVIEGGSWASTAYSGGGEAQIAFANGDTRYIVFSRMVRTNFTPGEPNDPAISDGVIVERGGKVLSVRICDDAEALPVQYDAAEAHLPRTDALFTDQTTRADPE